MFCLLPCSPAACFTQCIAHLAILFVSVLLKMCSFFLLTGQLMQQHTVIQNMFERGNF